MHDPMVVAFEIRRPWPRREHTHDAKPGKPRWKIRLHHDCGDDCRDEHVGQKFFRWWEPRSYTPFWTIAGRGYHFPSLITVWHVEPGGHDSGEVCKHYTRTRQPGGTWKTRVTHGWRWHIHHWRIQVRPLQAARRWLLTRCDWCNGPSRKGDCVNVSHQWDGPRGRWWQGEPGLYHGDCSSIEHAHRACLCDEPTPEHGSYGRCARCGKFRAFGKSGDVIERLRILASIPTGQRDAAKWEQVQRLAKECWEREKESRTAA